MKLFRLLLQVCRLSKVCILILYIYIYVILLKKKSCAIVANGQATSVLRWVWPPERRPSLGPREDQLRNCGRVYNRERDDKRLAALWDEEWTFGPKKEAKKVTHLAPAGGAAGSTPAPDALFFLGTRLHTGTYLLTPSN